MASHAISRFWHLRDLPRAYVLLALTAIVAAALAYFIDWSAVRRKALQPPPGSADNISPEQRYSGSIVVPTRDRDLCWELTFDNRTGFMQDGGYIKCEQAAPPPSENSPPGGADMTRLREVGKAFRHQTD